MKTTEITVTVTRTVRPAAYEAAGVTLTQTVTLDEGDDPKVVRRELHEKVSSEVSKMLALEVQYHREEALGVK